jgi:NAD(P)-dependent dehydrogenase (short-subunit alcohol dehydrogenase family)
VSRVRNKVALVTGGASGIGYATVERLLREGAFVAIFDQNEALLDRRAADLDTAKVEAIYGDVRSEADVAGGVAAIIDRFGKLDIGINCAGVGVAGEVLHMNVDVWDNVMAVDLRGVFLSTKHEARAMKESGGAIINIGSAMGRQTAHGSSAYCAAKAGVEMFTRCAAMELAAFKIRVCGIGPGYIDTPLTPFPPRIREFFEQGIPFGRAGRADEVANAVLFLASDEASWVTGDMLFVDGGQLTREFPRFHEMSWE